MENNILETLHEQFAENQNHHQKLFIQFLIALLVLFAGFGYVYVHTIPDVPYVQTYIEVKSNVEYFSGSILLITAIIVSTIMLLLNLILLNQGYGFRRDQLINKKIRKKHLNRNYKKIFGRLYNSSGKGFLDFLPDFYAIFFWFITVFQLFILVSVMFKTETYCLVLMPFLLSIFFYHKTYSKYKLNLKHK